MSNNFFFYFSMQLPWNEIHELERDVICDSITVTGIFGGLKLALDQMGKSLK